MFRSLTAAVTILAGASAGQAQVLRLVDEAGVIHYTNNPCAPQYARLAPEACPAPELQPGRAPEPGVPSPPTSSAILPHEIGRTAGESAARYGVDPRLVEAVVHVESSGNPLAVSPKGALGLMQLMPARAAALGVRDPFDPAANIDGGVRHLRDLLARYDGHLTLALAAYNAGEEAVRLHGGVPPYAETREYIRKVLALYAPGAAPKAPPNRPARPAGL